MSVQVFGSVLAVDLGADGTIETSTSLRFTTAGPVCIDTGGLQVDRVSLDGAVLHHDRHTDRLTLTGLVGTHELVIGCRADAGHRAIRRFRDPTDGQSYLTAGAEHLDAPNWFPKVANFPEAAGAVGKAPVTIDVQCPPDWTIVGNAPAQRLARGRWRIRTHRPLAPHLTALAAGPFQSVTGCRDDMTVGLYARAALTSQLYREADDLLAVVASCVGRLCELLGSELPAEKCDLVFVPDVAWRAMEYPGGIQLSESLLGFGATGALLRAERVAVVAHELAHMWFGNLVTPRASADNWLFEALAEYLGQRVAMAVCDDDRALHAVAVRRRLSAYHAARRSGGVALCRSRVPADRIAYVKGAAALADLCNRIGDVRFLAGLRGLVDEHRDGYAALPDLVRHQWATGARDIDLWERDWLTRNGIGSLTAVGNRLLRSGACVPRVASLRAVDRHGVTVGRWRLRVDTDSAASVKLPRVPDGTAVLLPNDDDAAWTYARFSRTDWETVAEVASHLDHRARSAVWTALQMAIAEADLGAVQAAKVAAALLAGETDDALLHVAATWCTEVLLWRHSVDGVAVIRRALSGVFASATGGSPLQATAARHLVDVAEAGPLRAALATWHGDLRWRAMTRLAALGAAGEAEIDAVARADRSAAAAVSEARCRAALPGAAAKDRVWRMLITPAGVGVAERVAAVQMFWHPLHRAVTAAYVPRYFAELVKPGPVAPLLARYGFPVTADMGVVLDHVQRCVRNDVVAEDVRWLIEGAGDEMRRANSARPGQGG